MLGPTDDVNKPGKPKNKKPAGKKPASKKQTGKIAPKGKGKAHHCNPGHLWELLNKPSRFATVTVQEKGPAAQEVKEGVIYTDYEPTTNKARVDAAHQALSENYDKALNDVIEKLTGTEQIDDQTSVTAQVLATHLQKEDQYDLAITILENLSKKLSEAGQLVQSASIWSRLTPEGALYYAERIARRNIEKDPKIATSRKKRAENLNKKAKPVIDEINTLNESVVDEALEQAVNNLGKKSVKDKIKDKIKEKVLKLKNPVVDEAKVQEQTLKEQQKKLEKEIKAEQKKIRPNQEKVRQLKLKLKQVEPLSPEEKLKRKVMGYLDPKAPKEPTPEQVMVNTLLKVAKQDLPAKGKNAPEDPLKLIEQAIKNREEYQEVYEKARKLVAEQYKDRPDMLAKAEEYLKAHFEKPYSEDLVQRAVSQYLKDNNIDLREIVKQHYFRVNKNLKSLQEALVRKANLTEEEAKILADSIAKELDARTRQAKTQRLKVLLRDVPLAQRRPLVDRIVELSNLGALNEASYRRAVADKLGVSPINETMAKTIFSKASELQNTKNRNERAVKTAELLALFQQLEPPSIGRKLSIIQTIGQLLSIKTFLRNVAGNSLFSAVEAGSDVLGTILDIGVSKVTGRRTKVLPRLKAAGSGFYRGAKAGIRDALKGIDTSNQASKFDLPKGRTFKNPVMRALETVLDLELKATDRAFYEMAFRESLINQLVALRKSKNYNRRARITPEMLTIAHQDALYKTFQDESLAAKLFVGLKRELNLHQDFGLGDFILKYPKTPANLLSRAFAYSPAGFVKAFYEVASPVLKGTGMYGFNQKAFVESFARATVGTVGVGAMGYLMGKLGLATGERGRDNDIESVKELEGMGSYKINASGVLRFALTLTPESAKPQKGDIWVSYDWVQPMAVPFSAAVNIAVSKGKAIEGNALDTLSAAGEAVFEGAETLTQQNLVKGLQDLFSVRDEEGDPNLMAGLVNVLSNAPSSFVPSISSQANQLIDNKIRETYDPNLVAQSINKVKAKVPGLAQTLPERYDIYGQPKERYQDGSNNLFNVFINPTFVSRMKQDPVGQEILGIYERSGETKQAPRRIPKTVQVTRDGDTEEIKMMAAEISKYQKFAGERTRYIFEQLIEDPYFQGLSDAGKANVMSAIMTDVHTAAKIRLFGHEPKRLPVSTRLMLVGQEIPYMILLRSKIMKQVAEDRRQRKISRQ